MHVLLFFSNDTPTTDIYILSLHDALPIWFVIEGSRAFGVAYLYANLLGNEAGRVIYDGGGLIASNSELVARGRRFSFGEVELSTAVIDIDANRREQARRGSHRPRHDAEQLVVEHPFVWPARRP